MASVLFRVSGRVQGVFYRASTRKQALALGLTGHARNLPDGPQTLPVQSQAMGRLPAGHFQLTKSGNHLQLAWLPDEKCGLGAITRETTLK